MGYSHIKIALLIQPQEREPSLKFFVKKQAFECQSMRTMVRSSSSSTWHRTAIISGAIARCDNDAGGPYLLCILFVT
jgi:hypothetical protein